MGLSSEGKISVAVGAVIEYIPSGEMLLLKRSPNADFVPGIWEIVTGRLRQFEEPEIGLKREVREEAGLALLEVVKLINVFHLFRGEHSAEKELIGVVYWCKTNSKDVTISDEHTDYQWIFPRDALKIIEHPGVRRDVEAFLRERDLSP